MAVNGFFFHKFLYDISNALHFMKERGFSHCDLKPENVLIDILHFQGNILPARLFFYFIYLKPNFELGLF